MWCSSLWKRRPATTAQNVILSYRGEPTADAIVDCHVKHPRLQNTSRNTAIFSISRKGVYCMWLKNIWLLLIKSKSQPREPKSCKYGV